MSAKTRTAQLLIQAMAKHLPPSASALRLLDIEGASGAVLAQERGDLVVIAVHGAPDAWDIEAGTFDAVVAYNTPHEAEFLAACMAALRHGGRFISVNAEVEPNAEAVATLEKNGYTRILVETGIECPLPLGALMRGERPHTTEDTLERVKVASDNDADMVNWDTYNGRYIHLLVKQTPQKPAWKLTPEDVIEWQVVAVQGDQLLGFSSLPKAVSFMQAAVLANHIEGVNKVAKFSRATAQNWTQPLRINATPDILAQGMSWIAIDPATAETPDE